ncbi:MAG TPA: response regulator [Allosphingosinicella sp.]|nr:response regulator [Allosphingosinicella sp.]
MANRYPVYVVDDDPGARAWIGELCEDQGIECSGFAGGEEFLAAVDRLRPGCVLLDMRMPRIGGLRVQAELVRRGSSMAVVSMTGFGGVETAVRSMKLGAVEFLEKPFATDDLLAAIAAAAARLNDTVA